jgi:hypothetical protein
VKVRIPSLPRVLLTPQGTHRVTVRVEGPAGADVILELVVNGIKRRGVQDDTGGGGADGGAVHLRGRSVAWGGWGRLGESVWHEYGMNMA